MVRYKCPKCRGLLESSPSLVGKYDECPLCHAKVLVPSAPASSVSQKKIIIGVIGAIAVVAAGFCIWFFAIRDTWERDHSSQILALHDQATELTSHNDLAGASATLHKILTLVGNRKLDGLRSVVDESRTSSQEIDRLLVLRELPKHLHDAAELLAADTIEESRAAYNAVLDAVSSQGTNEPAALRAADSAREGLHQVDARQAAIAAQRRQQESERLAAEQRNSEEAAAAKQRAEEQARYASVRATVSGGAWIVKGGGSSDLLRGMKVYLLKADCTGTAVRGCYGSAAGNAKQDAAFRRKSAEEYREKQDDYGIYKKAADEAEADANELEEYAAATVQSAETIPDTLSVHDAYRLVQIIVNSSPGYRKYSIVGPLGARFRNVVDECAEKNTQVNIDGKFSFDAVSGGRHYLYAFWSTAFSSIEWLVPLDVQQSATISRDLFNDTAEIISNSDK